MFIFEPLSLVVRTGLIVMLESVGTPIENAGSKQPNAHYSQDATLKLPSALNICTSCSNNASGFQFYSQLYKMYKRIIVTQLVLVELLNIFNFFMKFISGRRILPYRSRMQKSNAKIQSVLKMRQSEMSLKILKNLNCENGLLIQTL